MFVTNTHQVKTYIIETMGTPHCILLDTAFTKTEPDVHAFLQAFLAEQPVVVRDVVLMRVVEMVAITKPAFKVFLMHEVHCNLLLISSKVRRTVG